jgi:hypothetical protein
VAVHRQQNKNDFEYRKLNNWSKVLSNDEVTSVNINNNTEMRYFMKIIIYLNKTVIFWALLDENTSSVDDGSHDSTKRKSISKRHFFGHKPVWTAVKEINNILSLKSKNSSA